MKDYVYIRDIAVYHPDKVLDNDFFIRHFKKQGKDVQKLLEKVYNSDKRFVIESGSGENTLTMQIAAAKKVLEKTSLTGKDIDMILVTAQIPEYVVPACAVLVHRAISGKRETICYDVNANCMGMLVCLENTYRYMQSNRRINKVLIVGGEYLTKVQNPSNELGYGAFGDAACAIIVERTTRKAGIIDSDFFLNDAYCDKMLFPACGMSKIYNAKPEKILSVLEPVDCDMDFAVQRIKDMLARHNIQIDDITGFCLSQFSYKNVQTLRRELNISEEKSDFVGKRYGYTGTTSPFIVLYEMLKDKKIVRGDYVLFWTVGAGMQHTVLLIKY